MGTEAFAHTFCVCQRASTVWRTESAVLRTYSTLHPPSLHTEFLRRKNKQTNKEKTNKPHKQTHHHSQNNQARGQRLQRSHSHCSEKTCHLHHSTHAVSSGLAEYCLWGPAPDVLNFQMPGVPHPGDQKQRFFSMSCNYCSRMEKGWMCQGGNPQGKRILDHLNLLQITMKTLIWTMQFER